MEGLQTVVVVVKQLLLLSNRCCCCQTVVVVVKQLLLLSNSCCCCVEKIQSVDTIINNIKTSYFTQLKMCYLMTTFQCPSDILITSVNYQDVIKMSDGH